MASMSSLSVSVPGPRSTGSRSHRDIAEGSRIVLSIHPVCDTAAFHATLRAPCSGAVLVVGGGVQGSTETATLFIYRALDERQYVAAYTVALLLGGIALALVVGSEALRQRMED